MFPPAPKFQDLSYDAVVFKSRKNAFTLAVNGTQIPAKTVFEVVKQNDGIFLKFRDTQYTS